MPVSSSLGLFLLLQQKPESFTLKKGPLYPEYEGFEELLLYLQR